MRSRCAWSARSNGRGAPPTPDLELARKLRLIAGLIAGGFDTRIFLVTLGGFDTHARQAGLHAARLEELARSLNAFEQDGHRTRLDGARAFERDRGVRVRAERASPGHPVSLR